MDTKYDWSGVSENTNYIFTDQDGDVFESDFEPVKASGGWRVTGCSSWWFSTCEPFKGNWEDSLGGCSK